MNGELPFIALKFFDLGWVQALTLVQSAGVPADTEPVMVLDEALTAEYAAAYVLFAVPVSLS